MLPKKVKQSVDQEIEKEKPTRHSFYIYGFEDGIYRGATIALSALTPPGDLVEEMKQEMIATAQANEHGHVTIFQAQACAAVANRHMETLKAENERLRAEVAPEVLINDFMESKDYRNIEPNNTILCFLRWFDKHYSAIPKSTKP
jgi:hypothetical protein